VRRLLVVAVPAVFSLIIHVSAQQAGPTIQAAAETLGATKLDSVRFVGLGANFSVGQSASPNEPWPRVTIKQYDAAIDYAAKSMRVELIREQGVIPPRGGGLPFTGEQRFVEFVNGNDAWNVAFMPPPATPLPPGAQPVAATTPPAAKFVEQLPQPQFGLAEERSQQIWLTPHGFLKAAIANGATTRRVGDGIEVSFTMGGMYKFTGLINRQNHVERVQTSIANPVLGDMPVEALYSDYERIDGFSFPTRLVQKRGGYPSLDLWIFSVQPNAPVLIATPETVRTATAPRVTVEVQTIAEGVQYLTGGSHHSVAIEMKDHVVVVEAPLDEERSTAVIAKVGEMIPGKPIRFVVNTHAHFDHAGGLRTYVDHGVTIVTQEINRPFFEKAWAGPRTLAPDRLTESRKSPVFMTFKDKQVLSDGSRTIEVHRIANSPHHDGFALVYLPAEKIVIEADAYTPPLPAAPTSPAGPPPTPFQGPPISPTTRNLYENIKRLKLDVRQIAALHGARLATMEDLAAASGR
jgi:glyoxylase-like metal-dependent hydrolase (beta-lactamase superfamily II)